MVEHKANTTMRPEQKVCVLMSGGLDSALLLKECLNRFREVHPLYIACGLRWEKAERFWLKKLLKALHRPGLQPLDELSLPAGALYGKHWSLGDGKPPSERAAWDSVYLPGRNLLLLSLAGTYCAQRKIGNIGIGTLAGNPFEDSTEDFYAEMEAVFARLFHPIEVLAPLRELHKEESVRRAAGSLPIELTFSCIDPRGTRACGRCTKCYERRKGFELARLP